MANELFVTLSASVKGLTDGLKEASDAVRNNTASMSKSLDGLKQTFENIQKPFAEFAAIVTGGFMFKKAITDSIEYAVEMQRLSRTMGTSLANASAYSIALGRLDVSTEQYVGSLFRLQHAMLAQEAALNRNGIATRDSQGKLLNLQDVMRAGLMRVKELKEGFDQNALSQLMFGRSAAQLVEMQLMDNDALEKGARAAEQFAIVLDEQGIATARQYKNSLFDVGLVFKSLAVHLGQDLAPMFIKMMGQFSDFGRSAVAPIADAISKIVGFFDSFTGKAIAIIALMAGPLGGAFKNLYKTVLGFVQTIQVQYALGVQEAVVRNNALAVSNNALARSFGDSARAVQYMGMSLGASVGDKFSVLISSIARGIGIFNMFAVAVGGAAFALERLVTAERRAAEAAMTEEEKMKARAAQAKELLNQAKELEAAIGRGEYADNNASKAKEKYGTVIEQIIRLYPELREMLQDEKGNYLETAWAQRVLQDVEENRLNTSKNALQSKIRMTEQERDELTKIIEFRKKTHQDDTATGLASNLIDIKLLDEANRRLAVYNDNMRLILEQKAALNNPEKQKAEFVDPGPGRQPAWEQELAAYKNIEENWYTWSWAREMLFWQEKLQLTKDKTGERFAVEKKINESRKAMLEEQFTRETAMLGENLSRSKNQWEMQMSYAKSYFDWVAMNFPEESRQRQEALKKLQEIETAWNMDRLAAKRATAEAYAAMNDKERVEQERLIDRMAQTDLVGLQQMVLNRAATIIRQRDQRLAAIREELDDDRTMAERKTELYKEQAALITKVNNDIAELTGQTNLKERNQFKNHLDLKVDMQLLAKQAMLQAEIDRLTDEMKALEKNSAQYALLMDVKIAKERDLARVQADRISHEIYQEPPVSMKDLETQKYKYQFDMQGARAVYNYKTNLLEEWYAEQNRLLDSQLANEHLTEEELAKLEAKKMALKMDYTQKQEKLNEEYWDNYTKYGTQAINSFTSSLNSGIKRMLNEGATFTQAMKYLFTSMIEAIQNALVDMATDWVNTMIKTGMQELAVKLGIRKAEKAINAEAKADEVSRAGVVVSAKAAEAGSATTSEVSKIPGGFTWAVPAGIAILTAVLGMMAMVRSASGGWDLPAGGPYNAVLHSKEMVLPEKHANVIRSLADNQSSSGGSGIGSDGRVVQLIVNAVDSAGFERVLKRNQQAVIRLVENSIRGNKLKG